MEKIENIKSIKQNELYFSNKTFKDLDLSESTLKALEIKKYSLATEIQAKSIPNAMAGKDIMGTAKTGSGKSLAFLIPAVELLFRTDFSHTQGTGVIIITPTRELALQLYDVAKEFFVSTNKTCSSIIGGSYRKGEAKKLKKGVNLLIATPGRLLDHLNNTEGFNYKNLCMLVIDEADAILKDGFEDELKDILRILPQERQTLLYSATLSRKVENLVSLSLKDPIYLKIEEKTDVKTVSNLEQGYIIIPAEKKFLFLYTFINNYIDKKIMIFLTTCSEVQFYSDILNYVGLKVRNIHGDLKQTNRESVYLEFFNLESGVLLCTDIAQRGLDFPDVDWILQYDAPHSPDDYLHRVGRTARGAYAKGKSLLVLLPNEKGFIKYIEKNNNKELKEYEFSNDKLKDVQDKFEKTVMSNMSLKKLATDAFKSYVFVNKLFNITI